MQISPKTGWKTLYFEESVPYYTVYCRPDWQFYTFTRHWDQEILFIRNSGAN